MRRSRRQVLTHLLERIGLALVLLDVGLYFAVSRPVRSLVNAEEDRFAAQRQRIREEGDRVERLKKFREALPSADDRIESFERDHIPPRRRGYSSAARLLRKVAEQSGTQLNTVRYRLYDTPGEQLERLGMEVDVVGPFSSLLKFTHALETANDFILIRGFSFEPADGGEMGLRMTATLFLTR